MLAMYRLKWLAEALRDPRVDKTIANPWAYRLALILKAPGFRWPVTIRLSSGERITARDFSTLYILWEIFVERVYQLPELPDSPVIVDVGGNVGLFSMYALRECKNAQIIAYEPFPSNFDQLRRHVPGIDARPKGLAARRGQSRLSIHPTNAGMHSIVAEYGDGTDVELDGICDLPDRIDLLKLDCEGAEFQIIKSLRDTRIPNVLWEASPTLYDPKELVCHMKRIGYQVTRKNGIYHGLAKAPMSSTVEPSLASPEKSSYRQNSH